MKWVAVIVLAAGCAKPGLVQHGDSGTGGGADFATGGGDDGGGGVPDFATPVDLAGRDFAGADLTAPADLLGMCSLFPQSGCGPGEKCAYDGTGNSCASAGTVPNGSLCGSASADDCVKGAECVGAGGASTVNTCHMFCNADGDCTQAAVPAGPTAEPSNTAHCLLTLTGTSAKLCTFACNPVAAAGPSGCAAGLACQTWASATVPEFSDCGPSGAIGDGGNCPNGNSDCMPGFVCVETDPGPPIVAHCRKACRQAAGFVGTDCPAGGYQCVHATGATMFGFCCPGGAC